MMRAHVAYIRKEWHAIFSSLVLFLLLCAGLPSISIVEGQSLPSPVQFPGWASVSSSQENPMDVVIDHGTGDIYVTMGNGQALVLLQGGSLPKTIIFTSSASLLAAELIQRRCPYSNQWIYGVFFIENPDKMNYLPLPLPVNPSEATVAPLVKTVASGLLMQPYYFAQTYNSVQLYVAEYDAGSNGAKVSHWDVVSPAVGESVPTLQLVRNIEGVGHPLGVALTRDDNTLFFTSFATPSAVYKVTPMLGSSPVVIKLNLTQTRVTQPQKLMLHPLHNSADDYVLYVGNLREGNILQINSNGSDAVFLEVSTKDGYLPHGVTFYENGTIIIIAQDGLKVSCCAEEFDPFTTLAAYRNGSDCLPSAPVQFPGWESVEYVVENPMDVVIDHSTGDIYVTLAEQRSLQLLIGGRLPKQTIYTSSSRLVGAELMHRSCTNSKQMIYGLFFSEHDDKLIKFLSLPLPANPSEATVAPLVKTVASGLLMQPYYFAQTYNSVQLYVAEYDAGSNGATVSHWAVASPQRGESVPTLQHIRNVGDVGSIRSVALTKDDNTLFAAFYSPPSTISKFAPMLHGSPTVTQIADTYSPQKIVLHPLHNTADDFMVYVGSFARGYIALINSSGANEKYIDVNTTVGYRPRGVTFYENGTIIIIAQDGLKISCCVESFSANTDLPHETCDHSATLTLGPPVVSHTQTPRLKTLSKTQDPDSQSSSTRTGSVSSSIKMRESATLSLPHSPSKSLVAELQPSQTVVPLFTDAASAPPQNITERQENLLFVSLGFDPTTAEAVAATAKTALTATAFVTNPQVATSGVRVGMLSSPVLCRYVEELEDPDILQFVYPLSLDFGNPDSVTKVWTGSVLVTVLLLLAVMAITCVAHHTKVPTTILELTASVEATLLGYFLPSFVEAAFVIPREGSDVTVEIIVGVLCAVVAVAILLFFLYQVKESYSSEVKVESTKDPVSNNVKINFENTETDSKFVERYGPYFDRCRAPERIITRCSYFTDVLTSCLVGAASGYRAKSGCAGVAIFLLLVCLASLVFNVWLRPTRYKLDLCFLLIFNVVMLIQSVLALIIVVVDDVTSQKMLKLYDGVLFIAYVGFGVQLLVTAYWSIAVRQRRKIRRQTQMDSSMLSVPLLPVDVDSSSNSAQDASQQQASPAVITNPLQQ